MKRIMSLFAAVLLVFASLGVSAAEPENTEAKEQFSRYITEIYGSSQYMNYEELGQVNGYTYAYGAYAEATDTFYTAVLGDWVFSKSYIATPYKLGLYFINDNTVYTLESAYRLNLITDADMETVASLTKRVGVRKMDVKEKLVYNYLKDNNLYINSNYSYNYVGHIGGARSLVTAQTNVYDYSEVIGEYKVYSETNPWLFANGTQLFIVGDIELEENKVWSLKEACDEGIVTIDEVKELCDSKYVSGVHFGVPESDTEPTSEELSSNETVPTEPTSYMVDDPVISAIMKQYNIDNPNDITIDYRRELKNGMSLVHYELADTCWDCAVHNDWIGKYIYTYNHGGADKELFDGSNIYSLSSAYKKGIIGNAELKEISTVLGGMKEYKKTLEAGEQSYISADNITSTMKVSNSKILKLDKDDGTIYGLTKGTAEVSAKIGGKTCTCKVRVTSNPAITKNGKAVKSVTVKKGKTVKVRIEGKVKQINNKYTSTKYAKISAKKTDTVIKIKGVKKGISNVSITVNGMKFILKATVK